MMNTNYLNKISKKQPALGMFVLSQAPFTMEVCATLPLDWLAFDMEASATNTNDLLTFLLTTKGESITPFIRLKDVENISIEQALDLGASGIIAPKVNTAKEATAVSSACRYPPRGKRGVNPVRTSQYFNQVQEYIQTANDKVQCFVQIETIEALENIDSITRVKEVDGVFVGCGDLAMSLGTPGKMDSITMCEAIDKILISCQRHHKIPGIFAYNEKLANSYIEKGYLFVAIGNDIQALKTGVSTWLDNITLT